ncbi:glucoside xylosyltransferase 1 isoform X2 [Nematostella vectensis]|uniref:glucoside xylosyltransferase 1 isoform X2 n=1 Tax=Nematostella vectensis TaxID=45351 RepID=UPI00207747A1|nr:glucoside xylosyltransferase 1 isoform X2 [Nematostella vectensis]
MPFIKRLIFGLATLIVVLELVLLLFFAGSHSELEVVKELITTKASVVQDVRSNVKERRQTQRPTQSPRIPAALIERTLVFHILAESGLHDGLKSVLDHWPCVEGKQVSYKIHPLKFPEGQKPDEWKKLFKPCAAQRLFLPDILTEVDSLIYMDIDTLFLSPVQWLWDQFSNFNSSQLASMTPEGEVSATGWYNRFARHPYYGKLGLNSGVMLMNLTRMRSFGWQEKILPIYNKYRFDITWGDQDILNILFHYHPELVYVLSCEWNYRNDHCIYGNNCKTADTNGIYILHGNRGVFTNNKQPVFRAVYEGIEDAKQAGGIKEAVNALERRLGSHRKGYCGKAVDALLKFPRQLSAS